MIVEGFAGPGGWDVGAELAGIDEEILGIEIVRATCDTALAAGHKRLFADVREMRGIRYPGGVTGRIDSPPCQTFSQAGKGAGRQHLGNLMLALEKVAGGLTPEDAIGAVSDDQLDERSLLVLEPMLAILEQEPTWIAMEQVPGVLPIWQAYAAELDRLGYHTWTGHLHAETFGVPQTRKRAFLIAHADRRVAPPIPTHQRYDPRDPEPAADLFSQRWVSMGEALSLAEETLIGFPRRADGLGQIATINGVDYRARDLRTADQPSLTVTEKARSWKIWEPVFHDQSGTAYDPQWPFKRPATVVAGRGLIQNPGATANRYNGSSKSRNDGVQVSVAQAGVLQSFPVDYPWQGSRTTQFQQAGDAVPPLMAAAVLRAVTGT